MPRSAATGTAIMNPFEKPKKKFGELMLSSHYLSEEELDELLDEQKANPKLRIGYLCMKKRYAEAIEIMDVLLRQLPVAVPFSTVSRIGG